MGSGRSKWLWIPFASVLLSMTAIPAVGCGLPASFHRASARAGMNTAAAQDFRAARKAALRMRDGVLDPSFGGDGRVTTGFPSRSAAGADLAIQADGRIVVLGTSWHGDRSPRAALARYLPDGHLDPSFGGDGRVSTRLWIRGGGFGGGLAIQRDGRIVVAGGAATPGGPSGFAVARYLDNGALDPTFSADGRAVTRVGSGISSGSGVAIDPDGRIVVAGTVQPRHGRSVIAVVRYLSHGGLDRSFGGDGKVITHVGTASDESGGVTIQPDGRILVVGTVFRGHTSAMWVARYLPHGRLDRSFGTDGWVITRSGVIPHIGGTGEGNGDAVAVQPDGKIVVAGTYKMGDLEDTTLGLVRYHPNGSLDRTFGRRGKVAGDLGGDAYGADLVIQPDGKIVVASEGYAGRYLADGRLDPAFGTRGETGFFTPWRGIADAVAMQSDGRIVVGGSIIRRWEGLFAVARYK